ncbi:hypothetical protein TBR22_A31910 [Luteitalea sp. TBR-22]|uniref:hypothetical protein n=1 Tax=Luteitalea sp. TBR-22 TaxID=2802971 RepID=UPI001AFBB560|nr:hypothetical protein [Luteitalea sp. TBR-22]BCS33963.1 hypothetical protein TBR22_A31910 [Luteitalea sp. TBR-22]
MVTRPSRMPSFITDEDERLLLLLQADPQARQLLNCFAGLNQEDRREVSRVARACRDAHPALVTVPALQGAPLRLVR